MLFTQEPADCDGREEAEPMSFCKVLGAVVAKVELRDIPSVGSIMRSSGNTLGSLWGGVSPVIAALVVEHEGGNVVLPEAVVIGHIGLEIGTIVIIASVGRAAEESLSVGNDAVNEVSFIVTYLGSTIIVRSLAS